MSDPFEARLQRLFQEAPPLPDAPVFAARLADRLERGWTLRRLAIGGAGGGVGLLAMWRLMGTAGVSQLVAAVEQSSGAWRRGADLVGVSASAIRQALPYSGEVTWLLLGLLALAGGLIATRVVDRL